MAEPEWEVSADADTERRRRWRAVLGKAAEKSLGQGLSGTARGMDEALEALYQEGSGLAGARYGGRGSSSARVARWLGDIRSYFPKPVVQLLERDALERLKLHEILLQPELLEQVEPDIHLAAQLIALSRVIPARTRDTARQVVGRLVEQLIKRLGNPTRQALRGSLNRAARNLRPRAHEIDWPRTIHKNLQHYIPQQGTIIVEKLHGFGSKRSSLQDIILCVDQSGSMASSLVYAAIFGAVLASLPALSTRLVVFDTQVVDLSEQVRDPVDLLFSTQLGGGTDIHKALAYCQQSVSRPERTVLVLISDLYEGGLPGPMLRRAAELQRSGVQLVCLLALNDEGAPSYSAPNAAALAALGLPCFACTPELFPELLARALARRDIHAWAAARDLVVQRALG